MRSRRPHAKHFPTVERAGAPSQLSGKFFPGHELRKYGLKARHFVSYN
jgi:hypothetical protein